MAFNLPGEGRNRRILLSPHDNYEAAVGSLLVKQANGKWGPLATPLDVPHGGLGVATLTAHGVLIGEGTSAVAVTGAGTIGSPLMSGGASADPSFYNPVAAANTDSTDTTASTTYTDLAGGAGPSVTLTLKGTQAIIDISCYAFRVSTGNSAFISVAVSGASTVSATDANGTAIGNINTGGASVLAATGILITGLTPGSNTFTVKYRVDGGTAFSFVNRRIKVWAP